MGMVDDRNSLKKGFKGTPFAEINKIMLPYQQLPVDMALEKLTEERYQVMSRHYEEEQSGLKERRNQLIELIERAELVYENIDNFLPLIRKYTEINELNMQILNELIEKIVVYEKEENLDGSKSQRVDIIINSLGM